MVHTSQGSFGNNTYQALRKQVGPGRCRVLERIRLLEKNVNDILEKGVAIPQNGSDGSGGSQKDSGSVDSDEKNSSPEVNERIEKKNIAKNVKGIEVWGKVLDELKAGAEWLYMPIFWIPNL